jgi:hypothetical protein
MQRPTVTAAAVQAVEPLVLHGVQEIQYGGTIDHTLRQVSLAGWLMGRGMSASDAIRQVEAAEYAGVGGLQRGEPAMEPGRTGYGMGYDMGMGTGYGKAMGTQMGGAYGKAMGMPMGAGYGKTMGGGYGKATAMPMGGGYAKASMMPMGTGYAKATSMPMGGGYGKATAMPMGTGYGKGI